MYINVDIDIVDDIINLLDHIECPNDTLSSIKLYDMKTVYNLKDDGERYSAISIVDASKALLRLLEKEYMR